MNKAVRLTNDVAAPLCRGVWSTSRDTATERRGYNHGWPGISVVIAKPDDSGETPKTAGETPALPGNSDYGTQPVWQ